MPRRNRFDPETSAPVDGDWGIDHVTGVDPDRVAALLAPEDVPRYRALGYTPELRREGGPKVTLDLGGNDGEPITVRGLTLYTVDRDLYDARIEREQTVADERDKQLQKDNSRFRGGHQRRVVVGNAV